MNRFFVFLAALFSVALLVLAAREWSQAPPILPVDLPLVDLETGRAVPPRWVRLVGGRADLPAAALQLSAPSVPARVFHPLRSEKLAATRPARVVVATRDGELLAFFTPGRSKDIELDPVREPDGELLPMADASAEEKRQLAKLTGSIDPGGWLLREGEPPRRSRAYPYGFAGALGLLLTGLASRRGRAPSPSARQAVARGSASSPRPLAPPRPAAPPVLPVEAPDSATSGGGAERGASPENPIPDDRPVVPRPEGSAPPVASFVAGDAGIVDRPAEGPAAVLPPLDDAELRRRLFDYSSIATASSEEIPRRLRFVADKVLASPAGFRVFPVLGKPYEVEWSEVAAIAAWRCPNLTPWHERIVLELVRRDGSAAARPPVRLLATTRVELIDLEIAAIPGAAGGMRRLARAAAERAKEAALDGETRRWSETGAPPRLLATLRAMAEHDARFPDPSGGGSAT